MVDSKLEFDIAMFIADEVEIRMDKCKKTVKYCDDLYEYLIEIIHRYEARIKKKWEEEKH